MRLLSFIAVGIGVAVGDALAQAATNAPVEKAWSFSSSASTYIVPDSREYVQPTLTANHGLETGSAWIGYNFSVGEKLSLEFTPMLGGVFGDVTGVAPGYKYTLSWWKLQLYSEGEYVFDTDDSSESFFYTWSELTLAPVEWFRFGLVAQRTKLHGTEFDIQRGFLIGLSHKQVDFTTSVFNVDASRPTVVLGISLTF